MSCPDLLDSASQTASFGATAPVVIDPEHGRFPDDAVAVIGMACNFPGAASPDEFWNLLTTGASNAELSSEARITEGLLSGLSEDKTPSTSPQQRLLLQVVKDALQSSGYLKQPDSSIPLSEGVGFYLGRGAPDDNVTRQTSTAYPDLESPRTFRAGRISHFFGWKGPSMSFDTIGSSSAIAIRAACRAIGNGECSHAVAGGVSVFTSFLSPTGASKPSDTKAGGSFRAKGIGLVFLKKLSEAIAKDDAIMGVIAGSAVDQIPNLAPIEGNTKHLESHLDVAALIKFLLMIRNQKSHTQADHVALPSKSETVADTYISITLDNGESPSRHVDTHERSSSSGAIPVASRKDHTAISSDPSRTLDHSVPPLSAQQAFEQVRHNYDIYTKQTGFFNFWKETYPMQARLVLAYIVEAFTTLGCPIAALKPNEKLPSFQYLPKHSKVMAQYYKILKYESLVLSDGFAFTRTETPIDTTPALAIFQDVLRSFPQHASEHKLLHITGSRLADCLTGAANPLQLLFGDKDSIDLLTNVYTHAPMFAASTRFLGSFLGVALARPPSSGTYHILEIGGGTGGTTKYIVDYLIGQGIPFTFTFTDVSASLVAAAKKTFAGRDYMRFMTLDVEKTPPEKLIGQFHTIISSNCVHATKNLVITAKNIRPMLRSDGFLALVELTRDIPWLDLVFGLLEGWWLFEDGRKHALADEWLWDATLRSAGFKHVSWSDGASQEAQCLRVVAGFLGEAESLEFKPQRHVA